MLLYYSLATFLSVASLSNAQTWPYNLIGTWSTKSNKTLTGPVRCSQLPYPHNPN